MFERVFDRGFAIVQAVGEEPRILPRGDDLQRRIERHHGQLEADLIVALAGGAVGHGIRAGLMRHQHLVLRDQRAGDAGAEQVIALVGRVGTQHREAVLFRELLAQILDDDLVGAALVGLLFNAFQLAALAQLGGEGHQLDARIARLQPGKNDGRIEPAGISEHDLLRVCVLRIG